VGLQWDDDHRKEGDGDDAAGGRVLYSFLVQTKAFYLQIEIDVCINVLDYMTGQLNSTSQASQLARNSHCQLVQ